MYYVLRYSHWSWEKEAAKMEHENHMLSPYIHRMLDARYVLSNLIGELDENEKVISKIFVSNYIVAPFFKRVFYVEDERHFFFLRILFLFAFLITNVFILKSTYFLSEKKKRKSQYKYHWTFGSRYSRMDQIKFVEDSF